MSYVVEQKIRGKIYVYEATNRWDKKKKQARQTRKYLGVKDPEEIFSNVVYDKNS
jgi:hypothetical protein